MCSVVILRRPGHPWPVVIAANRDEMADRPWLAPGRHWPQQPAWRSRTPGCSMRLALGSGGWLLRRPWLPG